MDLMDDILMTLLNTLVCLVFPKLLSIVFTLKSQTANHITNNDVTSESEISSFETIIGVES
jgi:hypothetical protein